MNSCEEAIIAMGNSSFKGKFFHTNHPRERRYAVCMGVQSNVQKAREFLDADIMKIQYEKSDYRVMKKDAKFQGTKEIDSVFDYAFKRAA